MITLVLPTSLLQLLPGLTTLEAAMDYQNSHLKEGTKESMILQAQLKHLQGRFKSLSCPDGDEPSVLYTDSHGKVHWKSYPQRHVKTT